MLMIMFIGKKIIIHIKIQIICIKSDLLISINMQFIAQSRPI